jgi:DNA-binding NtrC family response regulator
VEALKLGAFDYVTKPVDPDELSNLVRNALRTRALAEENVRLKEKVSELTQAAPILAVSPSMEHVLEMIRTVAETDSSVVIRGESGTGKELVARAIHAQSRRRYFPLVAVNSGSIPETLLESELFGHEKGAYTGAQYRRKGKIELANGGTLFLDEIGDVTPKMQIDLLRVLESHRFTRLGGNQEISSDFRLICATHKNLEKLVEEESFREDLFYRINVFSIQVPPLRERPEDILPLTMFFVEKYARAMGKPVRTISPEAEAALLAHRWPGNVRELENAVERAMVVGKGPALEVRDLPLAAQNGAVDEPQARSLAALEKDHVARVLRDCGGNVTQAAKVLGIDRATLYNKLKRYGLRR